MSALAGYRRSVSDLLDAAIGREVDMARDHFGLSIPAKVGQGGPCPVCGGTDRFVVLNKSRDGRVRFYCRREGNARDLLDLMVDSGCVSDVREGMGVLNELL